MAGARELVNQRYKEAFAYADEAFNTAITSIKGIEQFVADMKAINAGIVLPRLCSVGPITVPGTQTDEAPGTGESAGTQDTQTHGALSAVDDDQVGDVSHPLPDVHNVGGRVDGVAFRYVTLPTFDAILKELENLPPNPDAPDISDLPDVPTFDPVVMPERPEIDLNIDFEGVRPTPPKIGDLIHPFSYVEEEYQWSFRDTIDQVVKEWLGDPESWFTLPQNYERAIFERDRSRTERERRAALENLMSEYSARGFSLPDGQLAFQHANLERETFNELSERSREIAFEQAKMALENARHAFGLAIQYETLLVQQDNDAKNRVLDAAKFAATYSVQVAELYVSLYNSEVEAYLADVRVYEALLKAEQIRLEIYKTDLEAASLQVQINQQQLDLYTATLDAYIKQVDLYKAQIEANNLLLEQNKMKIEEFAAQVAAYSEQVDAAGKTLAVNVDEINLQVQKEAAKSSLAEDTVKRISAYNAKEDNIKSQVATQVAKFEATLREFAAVNHNILQAIEADQAEITKQAAAVTSQVQRNQYLLSEVELEERYNLEYSKLDSDNQIRVAELDIEQAKYNLEYAIKQYDLALEALKAVGDISSSLAASSMSAVSASASMSSRDGFSASSSQTWSMTGDETNKQAFPIIQPS